MKSLNAHIYKNISCDYWLHKSKVDVKQCCCLLLMLCTLYIDQCARLVRVFVRFPYFLEMNTIVLSPENTQIQFHLAYDLINQGEACMARLETDLSFND